jgi:hypothetical protein
MKDDRDVPSLSRISVYKIDVPRRLCFVTIQCGCCVDCDVIATQGSVVKRVNQLSLSSKAECGGSGCWLPTTSGERGYQHGTCIVAKHSALNFRVGFRPLQNYHSVSLIADIFQCSFIKCFVHNRNIKTGNRVK